MSRENAWDDLGAVGEIRAKFVKQVTTRPTDR
jgi:hypothetical protein